MTEVLPEPSLMDSDTSITVPSPSTCLLSRLPPTQGGTPYVCFEMVTVMSTPRPCRMSNPAALLPANNDGSSTELSEDGP